ncbi:DUF488 family protein [Methylocystis sp. ATCC 49242]|uniref:DUF488 domain-containing protein n=1 Tax=Methylocystis sp. ATCC 49242 TaxID=622637 RepID=UPI0001F868BB|nr:DUF488 domain-containing protein [Methylocystis sp. ATCC 49242]
MHILSPPLTPQFNRAALGEYLKEHGIKYVFLGKELGARSDDPSCYVKGRVQYSRLAQRAEFHEGIERLKRGASTHRIALMCAEREPLECHRTLLVSRALESEAFDIKHIHANGKLEPHAEAMERLLDLVGLPREDLFRDKEDLLREALAVQESRVAYTNDDNAESEE